FASPVLFSLHIPRRALFLSLSSSLDPSLLSSLVCFLFLPLLLLSLSLFIFLSLSLPLILPGLAHCRPVSIYSHHALWQGVSRVTPLSLCRAPQPTRARQKPTAA